MADIEIVNKWMPLFWFHNKEQYFSMYITDYVKYCKETVDGERLLINDPNVKYGTKYQLQVLANITELHDDVGELVTDIVYYIWFPHNGPIGVFNSGEHVYDMEHITIRFRCAKANIQTATPWRVLYSIHSKHMWRYWRDDDVDVSSDNRLNVYIAKGSHAMYPQSKTYYRYMGTANDTCERGHVASTVDIIMYDPNNKIFKYKSVADMDNSRNWHPRELVYGELPDYYSYSDSITSFCFT